MKCLYCQSAESKVIDRRPVNGTVRRRRECLSCGRRFTTTEVVKESINDNTGADQ